MNLSHLAGAVVLFAPLLQVAGGGTISGTVTNAGTGAAVAGATIIIRRGADPTVPTITAPTDERGRYRSPELATGDYSIEAWPPASSPELIRLLHAGRPCAYTGCPLADAVKLSVAAPRQTTSIDFALPVGGSVSGTITDATTGEPLPHVLVTANSGSFQGRTVSGEGGRYRIDALVTGTYVVQARPSWDGLLAAPRDLGLRLEKMQSSERRIDVTAPGAVTAIDFRLGSGDRSVDR